ncbi:MAG: 4Fe-4S binding protein, partial [Coriobacteriales bacterium]|nr:4Fe-4S binding protein [Coriobacteriales bacterium]
MKKGLTFSLARRITIGAVIVLSVAGLLLRLGTGSLSSFGWQEIAAICPLGAIEGFLASRTIFPRALIMLVVIIILGILLGKVFCAWLCPVPPLRRLLTPHRKQSAKNSKAVEKSTAIAPASAPASSLASAA